MRTNDLKELLEVVEEIRARLHPDIGETFLRAVIEAEQANPEDATAATRAIEKALDAYLSGIGGLS